MRPIDGDLAKELAKKLDTYAWTDFCSLIGSIPTLKNIPTDIPTDIPTQQSKPKLTNADLIRQMTDEELAEWLDLHGECNQCAYHPAQCKTECNEGHLKWLKQEVKA